MGVRQRTTGARGHRRPVPHRHDARHQPRVPELRRSGRVRRPASVGHRGLGLARAGRPRRAAVLAPRGRQHVVTSTLRSYRRPPARRAGPTRVLVRGGGVRTVGGQSSAHRDRVGDRRRRVRRSTPPTSGARLRTGSVRPACSSPNPARPASGVCTRCSATCGSGPLPTSTATRASSRSPIASTPKSSSDPTTRCCAAGRGQRTPLPYAPRSATGTIRSVARSSPASAARGDA